MKKSLLVLYTSMVMGGATTSLLNFLNSVDRNEYDIDLVLYDHDGPKQKEIPPYVHVLAPHGAKSAKSWSGFVRRLTSPSYYRAKLRTHLDNDARKNHYVRVQIMSRNSVLYSAPPPEKNYDVSVSYLEFWPLYYHAQRITSKRKIAFIHVDYKESGMSVAFDSPSLAGMDRIVFVSDQCTDNFCSLCPQLAEKAQTFENILSRQAVLRAAGAQAVPPPFDQEAGLLRLVTVARISYAHKGHDRALAALLNLRSRGVGENLRWAVIGDGPDRDAFVSAVRENGLENIVQWLGSKENPLPYVAQCDAFFLPSRFEGKPIAVTEAQLLGLPVLVTHYASASEQVCDGIDGIIMDNSEQGIEQGLARLCSDLQFFDRLRAGAQQKQFDDSRQQLALAALLNAGQGHS